MAAGAFVSQQANAQAIQKMENNREGNVIIGNAPKIHKAPTSNMKVTAAGPRNYDHQAYVESVSSTMSGASMPMWHDSTIRQNFTSGLGTINFSSVADALYPFDGLWNDASNPNFLGKTAVTSTDAYTVDSVSLQGFYVLGNSGSASAIDTMIISVAYQPGGATYYWRKATSAWAAPYLPSGKDTLFWPSPINVDSLQRFAKSYPYTGTTTVTWKAPLDPTLRSALTSTSTFQTFKYKLPTPLNVPAGNSAIVSYTFKTGDTYNKNVDTITQRHHFRAGFAFVEAGTSTSTPMTYYWYAGDHSGSSIMFSTDSNFYAPTLVIGATNDATKWFNQYLLNTFTISCATCDVVKTIGINEKSIVSAVKAYPNPANNEINIPFILNNNAVASVSVSNLLGQTVATQNLGNIVAGQETTARFSTSSLTPGVYFYTVEANGQRITNRFTVAH